ncbi:MAG: hypothetical protein ACLP5H_23600 [Desulfomonilaceae bacterium]
MGLDTLTTFVLQNLGILVLLGLGITAIGIVIAIFLAASERRRSKTGSEGEQKESLNNLAISVRALEKSLEDLKNQMVKTDQEFAGQVKDVQKQVRTTKKDLDLVRREVDHLANMERMATSGTYEAPHQEKEEPSSEKENVKKESAKSGFWYRFKEGAEYAVPIWGQVKLIKYLRGKKKTGS